MVDYNHVALFVRVVVAGSFTAAAAAVGLPKSSVSRSVSRLEKELGVRLLQRTTRKLALTEVGRSYYESIRDSVASIDLADASARARGPAPTGTVRLTAPLDLTGLAPALATFRRKHPAIRIEVVATSRIVDLVAEGIDLALRGGEVLPDSSLVARRIGTAERALVASPAYLRRRGRPRSVADLPAHDWVLFRAAKGRATLELRGPNGDAPVAVEVEGALVADEMSFCRAAVEAGAGIASLPIPSLHGALAAGQLEVVLPGWIQSGASLFVVLPSGRYVPTRVALLRDFLVEALGKELSDTNQMCQRAKEKQRRDSIRSLSGDSRASRAAKRAEG